jgi:hypothetical protein
MFLISWFECLLKIAMASICKWMSRSHTFNSSKSEVIVIGLPQHKLLNSVSISQLARPVDYDTSVYHFLLVLVGLHLTCTPLSFSNN